MDRELKYQIRIKAFEEALQRIQEVMVQEQERYKAIPHVRQGVLLSLQRVEKRLQILQEDPKSIERAAELEDLRRSLQEDVEAHEHAQEVQTGRLWATERDVHLLGDLVSLEQAKLKKWREESELRPQEPSKAPPKARKSGKTPRKKKKTKAKKKA